MRPAALSPCVLLALAICLATPPVRATDGPGLGNLDYTPAELWKPVSIVDSVQGGHGNAALVNGYLMLITSEDAGGTPNDGGIEFWNVSNPRSPSLHRRFDDADTHGLREAHGFGFSSSYGADLMLAQSGEGIQVWDLSDPDAIALLSALELPGIDEGDYSGNWWTFWQAPWVFVAGVGQGLYVVDASDPAQPVLATRLATSALGNLNPATAYALGNLLVLMQNEGAGYVTLDISNPATPALIHALPGGSPGYSHLFAAGKILSSGGNGGPNTISVHDVTVDGTSILLAGQGVTACGSLSLANGGYGSTQDGFFFSGFSNRVTKWRIADRALIGCGSSLLPGRDEDFASVLGNLIWAGNDHLQGSALIPHQLARDTTGPAVQQVQPPDGALGQALTSRIGLSMSDHVDVESLGPSSFAVRPLGGSALPGRYSVQMGLVNFSPDARLLPNTTYEVVVSGIRDLVGNPGPSFMSQFSTGDFTPPGCALGLLAPVWVGADASLDLQGVTGSGPIHYSWSFADGTPATAPQPFSAVSHAFAAPGRYGVTLHVSNAGGSSSCSATQIVQHPPTALKPSASSPIIHDGVRSYSVNPDHDTVTAISEATLGVVWEAPVGDEPRTLALAPDGRLWVANQGNATIQILAATSGARLATLPLPRASQPHGIAFAPDGSAAYVTLSASGQLLKLSPAGVALGSCDVGPEPRGLAISGDSSRILVTRFLSPPAVLTDPANPGALALPAGEVREVSPDLALVRVFSLGFDPGPDTELGGRGVPNYLSGVQISPDGRRALVPSKKDNVARGLFLDGTPLDFESRTRAIVSELDLVANLEKSAARIDFNNRDLAQSLLFSPHGDLVFAALAGSNLVEVRDAASGQAIGALATARAPLGLALNSDASRLYVHEFLSRSVSVFDVSSFIQATGNSGSLVARIPAVAVEALTPEVLLGKQIFYNAADTRMNRDGYLSCASCHLEGGSDGQVWDFTQAGEGLRNTIELRGRAGTGHGFVHWSANFDEIQDFESDIRAGFSGAGFLSDADFAATADPLGAPKAGRSAELDALAAYVASLDRVPPSPHRAPDGTLTESARQGLLLFHQQGCASCHAGAGFTDALRHDVGTLQASSGLGRGLPLAGVGIETPTLKGVWATPPYLHNGQAATLEALLASSAHGETDRLTAAERTQLADFLRQLEQDDLPPADVIAVQGIAQGGWLQLRFGSGTLQVATSPGQSASELAAALAAAIASDAALAQIQATAVGASLALSSAVVRATSSDPGVSFARPVSVVRVPGLGRVGLVLLAILLGTAGTLLGGTQVRS